MSKITFYVKYFWIAYFMQSIVLMLSRSIVDRIMTPPMTCTLISRTCDSILTYVRELRLVAYYLTGIVGLSWGAHYNCKGPAKWINRQESENQIDIMWERLKWTFPSLRMEEAHRQEMWEASKNWKRQGNICPLQPSEEA